MKIQADVHISRIKSEVRGVLYFWQGATRKEAPRQRAEGKRIRTKNAENEG